MTKANIHRRDSLERVYPVDAFAGDAARNGRVPSEAVSGVRILSAPDEAGEFEFERTTRQVGEASSPAFLAPYRREEKLVSGDPSEGYRDFLSDIIGAAQRFGFRPENTPGPDEPRLRGLRQ